MSSTRQLQDTMNWASGILRSMPQAAQNVNQPAVDNANHVLQTVLGPPFTWPWNRNVATLNILLNTQDTTVAISDFGFLEVAGLTAPVGQKLEIKVTETLAPVLLTDPAEQSRPKSIQLYLDDNAGNYTFRVEKPTDVAYTAKVIYQKKAVLFTSPAGFWSPIPDELMYIYDEGFVALQMAFLDDPRFPFFSQRFMQFLLGRAQGLTEMQRNLFASEWMTTVEAAKRK